MIEGVKLIPVKVFVDDRGYIHQIIQASDNVFPKLERLYLVGNFSKGTVRAFHMHENEWKAFFVISGSAKFVLADGENKIETYVISSKNPNLFVVPPKIWHGWMSLEENTIILGISNFTIDETKKDDFRKSPESFGDVWTVKNR
jgi:dTDP-4-dehydrorhamnose 3,5-epimerase-like enzyme